MFELTGQKNGKEIVLTWDNGEVISSDNDNLSIELINEALVKEGEFVGPVNGPYNKRNHIDDELASLILAHSLFDEVTNYDGPDLIPTVEDGELS